MTSMCASGQEIIVSKSQPLKSAFRVVVMRMLKFACTGGRLDTRWGP